MRVVTVELSNLAPSAIGLHVVGAVYLAPFPAYKKPINDHVLVDGMTPFKMGLPEDDYDLRYQTANGTGAFTIRIICIDTGAVLASKTETAGSQIDFRIDFTVI